MSHHLRDYQLEASAAVERELATHSSTLVVQATGCGKSVLCADIAKRWNERGAVLWLAHRTELLDQAADHLGRELGYRPQVIQADREIDWYKIGSGQNVIVGSVQTLKNEKRLRRLDNHKFAMLIADEAHHCTAASWVKIQTWLRERNPDMKTLGVTATPKRTDKKALGIVFESVAYQMDAAPAIELGWLVDPIEERIIIDGVDFSNVPITFNELGEPDFSPSALEALMIEEGPLHAVAKPTISRSDGRSALVFTSGVAHAHLLAAILNREKPGSAAALDGKTTPPGHPQREKIMSDFRKGRISYLCNHSIACEGVDIPTCDMVVVARPTKSILVLLQMIGRSLRPLPGIVDGHTLPAVRRAAIAESTKPNALILYFSPKAANIKTATTFDALGGNYDDEIVELAKQLNDDEPGKQATERLTEAALLYPVLAQNKLRQKLKAEVKWRSEAVGNADAPSQDVAGIHRGGATDKQIEALIGLGVAYKTAAGYTAKQAWVVTDRLRAERCTNRQRKILERYGENPNVNFDAAKAIIDEIAANGWQPREKSA